MVVAFSPVTASKHIKEKYYRYLKTTFKMGEPYKKEYEALLENQVIFRYSLLIERFIKGLIADHFHHPFNCSILNLLTRLNILSIIKAKNLSGGKKNGKNRVRTPGQANQGAEIHG